MDLKELESISSELGILLKDKNYFFTTAESCTGGWVGQSLTSVPGSSKAFFLGLITYSNQSKIKLLKVPKKILLKHGSVSKETCISMLKNLNKLSKTYVSISITGIAGPSGGTVKKPVGLVFIGLKIGFKRIRIN